MKLLLIIAASLLMGCDAGDGKNLNENGQPLEQVTDENNKDDDNSNLVWLQDNIFTPICTECHGGANPAAGQDLSNITSSAKNLINVTSANPNFKRVLPGSPLESYLYLKVIGDDQAGSRMPLGKPALSAEAIDAIKQWIILGALIPLSDKQGVQISKAIFGSTQSSDDKKASLTLWFNQRMNFNTLDNNQIIVTASTKNAKWLMKYEKITLVPLDSHRLMINVSDISLEINKLKFSLNNNSISSIMSKHGQLLDGNYNDLDGGEFIYEHEI